MTIPSRPLTLLIAALGGEGGGVLTHWIVSAASSLGFPVRSTSIPESRSGPARPLITSKFCRCPGPT